MNIIYKTNPHPSNDALNVLFSSAWGHESAGEYEAILSLSLAHICAYDGDELIGYVNVAWDGGAHAFILDTSVHADHKRQGIATKLVQIATQAARNGGAKWLHADYEPHLAEFYQDCGFKPSKAGLIKL